MTFLRYLSYAGVYISKEGGNKQKISHEQFLKKITNNTVLVRIFIHRGLLLLVQQVDCAELDNLKVLVSVVDITIHHSIAKSTGFLWNWATLSLLPWVKATPIMCIYPPECDSYRRTPFETF